MYRILVAEEDTEIRTTLVNVLNEHGYKAIGVTSGEQALQMMEREYISLILCDAMLSKMDGYELDRIIEERNYNIPLLMFMSNVEDKNRNLKLLEETQGLLDYKDDKMILCRLQQMLATKHTLEVEHISFGDVVIEFNGMYVQIGDRKFPLHQEEFLIMGKFLFFPNKIYTRLQLEEDIVEMHGEVNEQLFEQYMGKIREIISYSREVRIEHIHGLGYKAVKIVCPQ